MECANTVKSKLFRGVLIELTSSPPLHFLLAGDKLLGLDHSQMKVITQKCESQEVESTGSNLEVHDLSLYPLDLNNMSYKKFEFYPSP